MASRTWFVLVFILLLLALVSRNMVVVVGPGFQDIVVVLVVGGPALQGSLTGCCCWSWFPGP